MKFIKFILVVFVSVSISNCSNNGSEPSFLLTNANLAGNYNIESFSANLKAVAEVQGLPVTVSTATNVGDTFQVDFVINSNGSYTASGQYRVVSTLTPVGQSPITTPTIVSFTDSGTFSIGSSKNTITFTSSKGDFLKGTFNVITFNENTVTLSQESEEVDGSITTTINATISFVRK